MENEGFASHTKIEWNGSVGTVEYGGGTKNMVAMFYTRPVHNPQKSTEAGRQIFEDQIYVRIHPPGERLNIIDRPANDSDRKNWPLFWAQYKENKQQTPDGTPIDLLYPDHPSIGAMLRANGVYTVDQCANLSGPAIDNIGMGAQRYVNDAKKYVEVANKGVKASQLRHDLEERDNKIRTLESQINMMQEQMLKMEEASSSKVDLNTIQALLAGQQGRPQFPANVKSPSKAFDQQTVQINATHTTREVANEKSAKRSRSRLT